jgi:dATP pyrophosphohydrolase
MIVAEQRRPVSVLVVVYSDAAEVLLLRRVRPFDFWQSVTGSLHEDESAASAASRELLEETGLSTEGSLSDSGIERSFTIDPRWRHRFAPDVTENLEFEWRYRVSSALAVTIDRHEHSEFKWCPIDEAIDKVWSWTNREALQQLRDDLAGNRGMT